MIFYAGLPAFIRNGKTREKLRLEETIRLACFFVSTVSLCYLLFYFHFDYDFTKGKKYSLSGYSKKILESDLNESCSIIYRKQTGILLPVFFPDKSADSVLIESQMRALVSISGGKISAEVARQPFTASEPEYSYKGTPVFTIRSLNFAHIIPLAPVPDEFEYNIIRLMDGGPVQKSVQVLVFGSGNSGVSYSLLSGILNSAGYIVSPVSLPENLNPEVPLVVAGLPSFFTGSMQNNITPGKKTDEFFSSVLKEFLLNGGRVVFFSSRFIPDNSWIVRDNIEGNTFYFDFLEEFLGIKFLSSAVYDPGSCYRIPMVSGDGSKIVNPSYPFWVKFSPVNPGQNPVDRKNVSIHPVFSGIRELCFFWPGALCGTSVQTACSGKSFSLTLPGGKLLPEDAYPFDASPFSGSVSVLSGMEEEVSSAENSPPVFCYFWSNDDGIDVNAGSVTEERGEGFSQDGGTAGIINLSTGQRIAFFADSLCVSDLQEMVFQGENARLLINCVDWLWHRDGLLDLLETKKQAVTGDSDE